MLKRSPTGGRSAWRCSPRASACAWRRRISRTAMPEVERDEHGHIRLAELELDRVLAKQVKDRFRARGAKVTVEGKNIGYELRCAPPIPFDIEYTRDLGYGAIEYLKRAIGGRRARWRWSRSRRGTWCRAVRLVH